MSVTRKINDLIEKTKHYDAHERYMATRDLIQELRSMSTVENSLQVPVRTAILNQLDDKSPDVSTIAVKCLSQIVTQFANEHVVFVLEKLGQNLVAPDKKESREMMADGLKSVLSSISIETGKPVMPKLVGSLVMGLSQKPDAKEFSLEMTCMDVLKEVLDRYCDHLANEHKSVMDALLTLLEHPAEPVRKRAGVTLGPLVPALNEADFDTLMQAIIKRIDTSKHKETYIQTIGVISRAAGVRVGQYLDRIVPQLAKFLKIDEEKEEDDAQSELWENCLHAFEAIIRRCPTKVTPFVPQVVRISLQFLQHDPNYTYEEEGEDLADAGDDFGDGDDWGSGEEAGGSSDWGAADAGEGTMSADSSWKVRRAAAGVLSAFIRVRSDILREYSRELADVLIDRFKERDSSVKEEVLLAMRDLLHETVVSGKAAVSDSKDTDGLPEVPVLVRTRSSYETLDPKIDAIIASCDKQFPKADVRTQKAIFAVLSELILVRRGNLAIERIVPHVISGIEAKGSDANADALRVLHLLLEFHPFDQLAPYTAQFTNAATKLVQSGVQTVIPEALRVIGSIANKAAGVAGQEGLGKTLFQVTYSQLILKDVTHKVKTASLSTMAVILASFGKQFSAEMKDVVPVFVERLGNDVTRQPALRAITRIANSNGNGADLSLLASNSAVIKDMTTFFRKTPPSLRQETVAALEALLRTYPAAFRSGDVQLIVHESASLISDEDLQLAGQTLSLSSTALSVSPAVSAPVVANEVLPKALAFLRSPLLQGAALAALIAFFQAAVNASEGKEKKLTYPALLAAITAVADASLAKPCFIAVAQCIAGITRKCGTAQVRETVAKFLADIKPAAQPHVSQMALLVLGELGQSLDLSEHKGIDTVIFGAMESKNDAVTAAASYALGNISVGSLNKLFPVLLSLIKSKPQYQYNLFLSVREGLSTVTKDPVQSKAFGAYVDSLTPTLGAAAEAKDEGVRSAVAQCFGLLTIVEPEKILSLLKKYLEASNPLARTVAIIALRFALSPLVDWNKLAAHMSGFLSLLRDVDLGVRREAILSLNAVLRANVEAIDAATLKGTVLPALYAETKIKPELVSERDYGAFKETIDEGLPLRKAAFQCLSTLLDVCPHRLNLQEYLHFVQQGLTDSSADIQISTWQTFSYIGQHHGSALLEILNGIPGLVMDTVKKHLSAIKGKEPDQTSLECMRSFLRACLVLNAIPGVEQSQKYTYFFKQLKATAQLAAILAEIEAGSA